MPLDQVIEFTTQEGNVYILEFSVFESDLIPEDVDINIVDITLIAKNRIELNNLKSLYLIADHVKQYLKENNAILYYYCDHKDVERRDTLISPQEYRHKLFNRLIERKSENEIIKKSIIISDEINGNHFMKLFKVLL